MPAYSPDATVTTEPVDTRPVASAAAEFRALKAWIQANAGFKYVSVFTPPAGAYQLVAADAGRGVRKDDAATVTVPANATVGFPVGTLISGVNDSASVMTLAAAVGVTLYLAGTALPGNRTLSPRGMWTIWKVATDTWYCYGAGVS